MPMHGVAGDDGAEGGSFDIPVILESVQYPRMACGDIEPTLGGWVARAQRESCSGAGGLIASSSISNTSASLGPMRGSAPSLP